MDISKAIPSSSKDSFVVMKSVMELILNVVPDIKLAFDKALNEIAPNLNSMKYECYLYNIVDISSHAKRKIGAMSDSQKKDIILNEIIDQVNMNGFCLKSFIDLAADELMLEVLQLKKIEVTSDNQKTSTYIQAEIENKIAELSKACLEKFSTADKALDEIKSKLKISNKALDDLAKNAGCTSSDWCKYTATMWKEKPDMDAFARQGTNTILDTLCKLNLPSKPTNCAAKQYGGEYCSSIKTCINSDEIDSLVKSISNSPTDSYFNE